MVCDGCPFPENRSGLLLVGKTGCMILSELTIPPVISAWYNKCTHLVDFVMAHLQLLTKSDLNLWGFLVNSEPLKIKKSVIRS
jgi:hypothetical protein